MNRARVQYNDMCDAKDDSQKRFHKERLSVYQDFFLRKLKPSDWVEDPIEVDQSTPEKVQDSQFCNMIARSCFCVPGVHFYGGIEPEKKGSNPKVV